MRINESPEAYLTNLFPEEPAVLARQREETSQLEAAATELRRVHARFMTLLLRSIGARSTIEVSVFTGYSTLITALPLPDTGRVIACDINREWTDIARRYWREAGIEDRIDLRIAPAAVSLDELVSANASGSFDSAFIDADKTGYDGYYERCLSLLRPGGLIAIDNALWGCSVADSDDRKRRYPGYSLTERQGQHESPRRSLSHSGRRR